MTRQAIGNRRPAWRRIFRNVLPFQTEIKKTKTEALTQSPSLYTVLAFINVSTKWDTATLCVFYSFFPLSVRPLSQGGGLSFTIEARFVSALFCSSWHMYMQKAPDSGPHRQTKGDEGGLERGGGGRKVNWLVCGQNNAQTDRQKGRFLNASPSLWSRPCPSSCLVFSQQHQRRPLTVGRRVLGFCRGQSVSRMSGGCSFSSSRRKSFRSSSSPAPPTAPCSSQ